MQFWSQKDGQITLPSGRVLELGRARSEGPLDPEELELCRTYGVPLAYDPAHVGWVPASCQDDLAPYLPLPPEPVRGPKSEQVGPLRFRRWEQNDVEAFVALLDNPKVWKFLPEPYPDPLTKEDAASLIEVSLTAQHHDVRAVEMDGRVVGQVRLAFDLADHERTAGEISYWLGERYWGQGIGSEMVSLFTLKSFETRPELSFIWARVHENNLSSARVLQKAGYRDSGPIAGSSGWRRYRVDRTVSVQSAESRWPEPRPSVGH
jgi:RimJ/RimL family protein N-acetyltransferase